MTSAIRDGVAEGRAEAPETGAEQPAFDAEIVEPATATGRLLTRAQVAERLGTSVSTVRRMEGAELKPRVGPRGVRYFEETEIQAVIIRTRRVRVPDVERAEGVLAARAFELFRGGADIVAVVKALEEPPDRVEKLHAHWLLVRAFVVLDAKGVRELDRVLGADDLVDEGAVVTAISAFEKQRGQRCVLCERERAFWCKECAREKGKEYVRGREARKLF